MTKIKIGERTDLFSLLEKTVNERSRHLTLAICFKITSSLEDLRRDTKEIHQTKGIP